MAQEQTCKVLLIEDNPTDARLMEIYLSSAGAGAFDLRWADRLSRGVEMFREATDVAVLDLTLPDSEGLNTFLRLREVRADVPIIVLTGMDDQDLAVEAVRRGAQDYLVKNDVRGPALVRAIRYAVERHRATSRSRVEPEQPRVIGFLGAKGGVGTSTVALNVSAALARTGAATVFAELRPYPSTLHLQLQAAPAGSSSEFAGIDPGLITEYEVTSRLLRMPWEVRVLFGPRQWEQPAALQPAQLEALLRGLQASARCVVLDLVPYPPQLARIALQACHYAAIVTDLEPVSLGAARALADLAEGWGMNRDLVGVVGVNRSGNDLQPAELQEATGCEVAGIIPPASGALLEASQACLPIVLARPDSSCGAALTELGRRLAASPVLPVAV